MGFIANAFKSIFSPSVPQVTYENAPTGRDLLQSTSSDEVEAPVMGSDGKKRNRGLNSLLVPTENVVKGT